MAAVLVSNSDLRGHAWQAVLRAFTPRNDTDQWPSDYHDEPVSNSRSTRVAGKCSAGSVVNATSDNLVVLWRQRWAVSVTVHNHASGSR